MSGTVAWLVCGMLARGALVALKVPPLVLMLRVQLPNLMVASVYRILTETTKLLSNGVVPKDTDGRLALDM